ncbi:MAG: ribonuclease H-like domain-containing protein [Nitrososphaerota archaeon]|nr:ribonuclease H-like domain-containing protein [Nitrososphaerota archaeon]
MALANSVSTKIREAVADVNALESGFLVGAGYDGEKRLAFLKFYDQATDAVRLYFDKTGHKPYCFSKEPLEELAVLKQRPDVLDIQVQEKMDLIADRKMLASKIITSDPLAIGGSNNGRSIRDAITAYEADIKYYENYLYDTQLQMGTQYRIAEGKVEPVPQTVGEAVEESIRKATEGVNEALAGYIRGWALLLTQPQPSFRRAALDIEVLSPEENRIPEPEKAEYQVISAALVGNDGKKTVFELERSDVEKGEGKLPPEVEVRMYRSEGELILSLFEAMMDYPVIVTFNGDQFDMVYLYHRALNLQVQKESIPISLGREVSSFKGGLHIDLYKAYNNRSIQIYAFGNRYTEHTLNAIASALLGREKVGVEEGGISQLPLATLAYYNYTDAELTLELTTFNNDLFFRLYNTICRISKMPLEDASRMAVSQWIKSLLIFEHRKWNALVPNREDLRNKGAASSEAIIKGKKYKGGLVIEPLPGVHFGIVVLDFASLYPSIIKVHNLSYETVNCPHEECKTNRIPETDHWVCRLRKGITSLLIGSLRDVRVGYFKGISKRADISKQDKEFYNVISQSLKVFLNASYGVMGFENFPLYCLPVAEATAALGRYSITKTIDKAKSLGIEVAYGDSVCEDTLVRVRRATGGSAVLLGQVEQKTMGELFVRTDFLAHGGKEYCRPDGVWVETVDDAGKVAWARVLHVVRHRAGKPVCRVWLSDSRHVDVTEDHSLIGARGYASVRPSEAPGLAGGLVVKEEDGRAGARRVTKVERVGYDGFVYDLEVEGTHRFFGNGVLLHNTDSLFLKSPKSEQVEQMLEWAKKELGIELEIDKVYRYAAFSNRKKNYFGVYGDGSVEIKGLTGKKSLAGDTPILARVDGSARYTSVREAYRAFKRGSRVQLLTVTDDLRTIWSDVDDATSHRVDDVYVVTTEKGRRLELSGDHSVYLMDGEGNLLCKQTRRIAAGESLAGVRSIPVGGRGAGRTDEFMTLLGAFCADGRDARAPDAPARAGLPAARGQGVPRVPPGRAFSSLCGRTPARRRVPDFVFEEPRGGVEAYLSGLFHGGAELTTRSRELAEQASYLLATVGAESRMAARGRGSYTVGRGPSQALGEGSAGRGAPLVLQTVAGGASEAATGDVAQDRVLSVGRVPGSRTMYDFSVPRYERFVAGNMPTLLHNSNIPDFIKQAFRDVAAILAEVKTPEDFEAARERIRTLLKLAYQDLKSRKVSLEELAFHVMMNKPLDRYVDTTPQHVKAAQILKQRGKDVRAGEIISFVKTMGGAGVKPVEYAKPEDIDVDKYVEYIRGTFDQLLDALGYEFDEILGATKLEDFFGF